MSRVWALLRFCAALAPIGLLGHLIADAFDAPAASLRVITSPHIVLAMLALLGCAVVLSSLYRMRTDARRALALFFKDLPGGGGVQTAIAASLLLTGFIAITQSVEGALAAVSLLQALLAAVAISVAAVAAVAALRASVAPALQATHRIRFLHSSLPQPRQVRLRPFFAVVAVRGNRPPPRSP